MRKLIFFLLLTSAAFCQQVNNDVIPASSGLNIGHSNQRWNAFIQNLDINGTCTINGLSCLNGFPTTCSVGQTLIWSGAVWQCSSGGVGTLTGVTTSGSSGLQGGGLSGTLNMSLITTCSSNQVLVWSGTSWGCGAATLSGTGLPVVISNATTVATSNIPLIDIRWYFTNPFPTYAQAQSQDFGAVLNAALVAATSSGACVDVSGINLLNAPNVTVLYATTNPFSGILSNTYTPCILGANFEVISGATWATPGGSLRIVGGVPGGLGGTGLVIQPCNTTSTCSNGSGGVSVNQFPTSAGCASSGGTNCYATGLPSSSALATYTTGTVTYNTGNKTVTGSGTTWTSAMIGGTFVSACASNTCTVGSTNVYTTGRIVNVSSSTSLTLDASWAGTLNSGSAGQNYIIFKPNTSVVFCDSCIGNNLQKSFTGHEITNLTIDLNGISGAGFYTKSSQEGSILNNYFCALQGGTPSGATAGGTCLAWDQSVRESGATNGVAANTTFLGHWSVYGGRMGVGQNAGGSSAFGVVIEGFSQMDGTVALSQANGPSVFEFQAVIGGAGSARFQDAVYIDGLSGIFIAGTHVESTLNDNWNIGPVNPVYNISLNNVTSSGTLGGCAIEFNSGSSGNEVHGISRPGGGCLVKDDNLTTTTVATSTAGTPSTWTVTDYIQPGNSGASIYLGGVESPLKVPIASISSCTAALEGAHAIATTCNAGCSAGGTCTTGGTTHCEVYCNSSPAWVETGR